MTTSTTPAATTSVATVPALKEWGAVAHALLEGRQALLLRKGGVGEKRFAVGADRFLLFPTVAHSHAEAVRPEHHDLLARGAADVADDAVVVRALLEVVEVVPVTRPERVGELADLHVWTTDSVRRSRVDFRPRHLLTALVVRSAPLLEPLHLPRRPEQVGCFSWLDLPLDPGATAAGAPARTDEDLREVAAAVRARVS
ncbi:DUF1802 family protein [Kineococcus sp. SYSU DK004]|uniref:DUF1802 family protein n=1 Tax=Kineococcus sp. SYSU DK004 TaxID=3383125 RepID=UPI003D7D9731